MKEETIYTGLGEAIRIDAEIPWGIVRVFVGPKLTPDGGKKSTVAIESFSVDGPLSGAVGEDLYRRRFELEFAPMSRGVEFPSMGDALVFARDWMALVEQTDVTQDIARARKVCAKEAYANAALRQSQKAAQEELDMTNKMLERGDAPEQSELETQLADADERLAAYQVAVGRSYAAKVESVALTEILGANALRFAQIAEKHLGEYEKTKAYKTLVRAKIAQLAAVESLRELAPFEDVDQQQLRSLRSRYGHMNGHLSRGVLAGPEGVFD